MPRITLDERRRVLSGDMSFEEIEQKIAEHMAELKRAADPSAPEHEDRSDYLVLLIDLLERKLEVQQRELDVMAEVVHQAEKAIARLVTSPKETWIALRDADPEPFQSRAFAELLLTKAEKLLETEPEEAQALAAFLPVALIWAGDDHPWAEELRTRAASLRDQARRLLSQRPSIH